MEMLVQIYHDISYRPLCRPFEHAPRSVFTRDVDSVASSRVRISENVPHLHASEQKRDY